MTDLVSIRAILHSKNIDANGVKPYTGLHLNTTGDIILSTPSLESYRVNNDPLHPYESNVPRSSTSDVDNRILSYDLLENRRYQSLKMKQPVPHYVTRIYQERFGIAETPRSEPSKTVRVSTAPGYRLLLDQLPNQNQTMVSQRFNKLSPFVTDHGTNPNANPVLRQSMA